ncbi:hypothetical protein [uncultured Aquimarina sp.]|uniref:hypothetical protein n=1 Tax=uncultured Aquimarina sp. TaxID=575652 RepID=UPI00262E2566|nr:hypothetical protein [uncultured Aquimarina sp.]
MKIIKIKRKTEAKNIHSKNMGRLSAQVTSIKKYLLGIPITTLHKYRETYYGEIKDCKDCLIHA